MPLLALHLPKSHTEAIMCTPQIITYTVVEKGITKISFGRTMMQALESDTSIGAAAVGKNASLGMK